VRSLSSSSKDSPAHHRKNIYSPPQVAGKSAQTAASNNINISQLNINFSAGISLQMGMK
jgi:hypothetical protein